MPGRPRSSAAGTALLPLALFLHSLLRAGPCRRVAGGAHALRSLAAAAAGEIEADAPLAAATGLALLSAASPRGARGRCPATDIERSRQRPSCSTRSSTTLAASISAGIAASSHRTPPPPPPPQQQHDSTSPSSAAAAAAAGAPSPASVSPMSAAPPGERSALLPPPSPRAARAAPPRRRACETLLRRLLAAAAAALLLLLVVLVVRRERAERREHAGWARGRFNGTPHLARGRRGAVASENGVCSDVGVDGEASPPPPLPCQAC
jgi:hypothetical protein